MKTYYKQYFFFAFFLSLFLFIAGPGFSDEVIEIENETPVEIFTEDTIDSLDDGEQYDSDPEVIIIE